MFCDKGYQMLQPSSPSTANEIKVLLAGNFKHLPSWEKLFPIIFTALSDTPPNFIPTVLSDAAFDLFINSDKYRIILNSTNGSEDYDRIRHLKYPGTNVCVLLCNSSNPDSVSSIETQLYSEAKHYCPAAQVVMINLNTTPLLNDNRSSELARKLNIPYLNCKTDDPISILATIDFIIRVALSKYAQNAVISTTLDIYNGDNLKHLSSITNNYFNLLPPDLIRMFQNYCAKDGESIEAIWKKAAPSPHTKAITQGLFNSRGLNITVKATTTSTDCTPPSSCLVM